MEICTRFVIWDNARLSFIVSKHLACLSGDLFAVRYGIGLFP